MSMREPLTANDKLAIIDDLRNGMLIGVIGKALVEKNILTTEELLYCLTDFSVTVKEEYRNLVCSGLSETIKSWGKAFPTHKEP
jgi:hypothetical protein